LSVPVPLFFKIFVFVFVDILLNANRTKRENEREYIYEQKRKGTKIIVVMASRRRAMKELGRVTFSPDTTSGGGSPRGPLRGLPKRERYITYK
jgi:hypothetical protein